MGPFPGQVQVESSFSTEARNQTSAMDADNGDTSELSDQYRQTANNQPSGATDEISAFLRRANEDESNAVDVKALIQDTPKKQLHHQANQRVINESLIIEESQDADDWFIEETKHENGINAGTGSSTPIPLTRTTTNGFLSIEQAHQRDPTIGLPSMSAAVEESFISAINEDQDLFSTAPQIRENSRDLSFEPEPDLKDEADPPRTVASKESAHGSNVDDRERMDESSIKQLESVNAPPAPTVNSREISPGFAGFIKPTQSIQSSTVPSKRSFDAIVDDSQPEPDHKKVRSNVSVVIQSSSSFVVGDSDATEISRKRGRPRKQAAAAAGLVANTNEQVVSSTSTSLSEPTPTRGRGRPPKTPTTKHSISSTYIPQNPQTSTRQSPRTLVNSTADQKTSKSPSYATAPRILFSNSKIVHRTGIVDILKKQLQCTVVNSAEADDFDVLVTDENDLKKTSKFLNALILGKPIVSDAWAVASAKDRVMKPYSSYIAQNKAKEYEWGVNLKKEIQNAMKQLSSSRKDVFRGKHIIITPALYKAYGHSGYRDVCSLAKLAGASDVRVKPARDIMALLEPNDDDSAAKSKRGGSKTAIVASSVIVLGLGDHDVDTVTLVEKSSSPVFNREMLTTSILKGRLDLNSSEFRIVLSPSKRKSAKDAQEPEIQRAKGTTPSKKSVASSLAETPTKKRGRGRPRKTS